ncbi:hypothetical protein GO491_01390 [Flavobacteriaceae bacterium Ap0902]|nr:hypothetical protein [Flavobacteriaceae bacterium Ap0902]
MKTIFILLSIFFSCLLIPLNAQGSPDYTGGFKIKFNEDGSKYLRTISWVQGQVNYNTDAPGGTEAMTMQLRRARVLMFSQITPKFMLLTHFGVNSLGANTMSPTGKGEGSQVFMHDAWAQYNFIPAFTLGMGLHYFNGISRLSNQSTLNMLTLDNNRSSWATLGLSDQFARHVGLFAKGSIHNFQYQVSFNEAMTANLDARDPMNAASVYRGKELLGGDEAGKTFSGYFQYGFLDKESDFLPFRVGSYLGGKKVFNVGAGFFAHPKGAVRADANGDLTGEDVSIFAVDVFYDAPISAKGDAITAYAVYQNNDYGEDYLLGPYGTGNMLYGHVGYLLPGNNPQLKFQPYVAYSHQTFDATQDDKSELKVGLNAYMSGHHAKFTLEYDKTKFGDTDTGFVNLQAMVYL